LKSQNEIIRAGGLAAKTLVRFLCCCLLLLCLFYAGPAKAQEAPGDAIGIVIAAEGNVFVQRGGAATPLALKSPIFLRDTVGSGADGRLQILLNDESSITIGPDTYLELQEFAQAGRQSAFAANLSQGALRVITGLITEANPGGFSVATPLGTVGIRGTILIIDADDRHTTVRVLNSDKTVLLNGAEVPEYFKLTVRREGDPELLPLTAQERADDGGLVLPVNAGGAVEQLSADGAPDALDPVAAPGTDSFYTDIAEHQTVQPALASSPYVAGTASSMPMTTYTDKFTGSFRFDIDLSTGAISNGVLVGQGRVGVYYSGIISVNFSGGTGAATVAGFNVNFLADPAGVVRAPGTAYEAFWPGEAHIENVMPPPFDIFTAPDGSIVDVKYIIFAGGNHYDDGTGPGTVHR
jgi:hypothetical protein